MKKILIWNSFPLKERSGGPPTYLYNLSQGLCSINNVEKIQVVFLGDLLKKNGSSAGNGSVNYGNELNLLQYVRRFLPRVFVNNIRFMKFLMLLRHHVPSLSVKEINEFDGIHFHTSLDVYKNRNILKQFKGKVFLTSHSPEPSWIEAIEAHYNLTLNEILPSFKKQIEEADIWGFKRANKLIFPCNEAIEPYLKWEKYKEEVHPLAKYAYIVSGIAKAEFKLDRRDVRKELNIPEDAIVFSYIGRHSSVKGYDLLRELGAHVLNNQPNIYFLVAGKEEPLKGVNHKNWIEVGWTNDPHSFVNASDVFILPNRQTYFDLVLLEVMSLGKPVILSDTGGNKHFKKYKAPGLIFFESNNLDSLKEVLQKTIECRGNLEAMGASNQRLFNDNFNISEFTHNYIELFSHLLN